MPGNIEVDIMTLLPWSRLENSALWRASRARHDADIWRDYHAFTHPMRMYGYARTLFDLSYDPHLDRAILAHDVIQSGPDPVGASADWLDERLGCPDPVAREMIEQTRAHRPGPDNRIILLDLADFLHPEQRRASTVAILREGQHQHPLPDTLRASAAYLEGLQARLHDGMMDAPAGDRPYLRQICSEIRVTIDETLSRLETLPSSLPGF